MTANATSAEIPADLDAWLAANPDLRATLERDGFGQAFTSEDLLPLLQAMLGRAAGPSPAGRASAGRIALGIAVFLGILILILLLSGARPIPCL